MSTKEILYRFIQLGLGTIDTFDVQDNTHWKELIDIALAQGVVATSFESYKKIGQKAFYKKLN